MNGGKMVEKNKLIVEYFDKIYDVPLEKIVPNPNNPREKFLESEEDELIESILSKGILNPIVVYKRNGDGKYGKNVNHFRDVNQFRDNRGQRGRR